MDTPIYLKIKNIIKDDIQTKKSNEAIESERALAIRHDASRMTVRRAIDELVEEGFLYRKRNKGTFISDKSLWKVTPLEIGEDKIDQQLINFDIKFGVSDEILSKLELTHSKVPSIIRAVRLVLINKEPKKIEEFYIIRNFIEHQINDFEYLLDLNNYLDENVMRQKYIPMIIPVQYASMLKISINTPIIKTEGVMRDISGKAFLYYIAYSHPKNDIIEYTL